MSDVLSSLGGSRVPELSSSLAINTSFTLPNHPCSFMYELGVLINTVNIFVIHCSCLLIMFMRRQLAKVIPQFLIYRSQQLPVELSCEPPL